MTRGPITRTQLDELRRGNAARLRAKGDLVDAGRDLARRAAARETLREAVARSERAWRRIGGVR